MHTDTHPHTQGPGTGEGVPSVEDVLRLEGLCLQLCLPSLYVLTPDPGRHPKNGAVQFLRKKKKKKKKPQNKQKSKSMRRRSKVGLLPPTPGLRVLHPPGWRGLLCFPVARGFPPSVRGRQTRPTRRRQGSVTWAAGPVSVVGTVEAPARSRAPGAQSVRPPRRAAGAWSPRVGGGGDGGPRAGPRHC